MYTHTHTHTSEVEYLTPGPQCLKIPWRIYLAGSFCSHLWKVVTWRAHKPLRNATAAVLYLSSFYTDLGCICVKPFKYRGIPVQLKELLTKTERIVKYAEVMDIIIVVLTVYFGIRALHSSNNGDSPAKCFVLLGSPHSPSCSSRINEALTWIEDQESHFAGSGSTWTSTTKQHNELTCCDVLRRLLPQWFKYHCVGLFH